jgi:cytochrome c oxidase subunit 2
VGAAMPRMASSWDDTGTTSGLPSGASAFYPTLARTGSSPLPPLSAAVRRSLVNPTALTIAIAYSAVVVVAVVAILVVWRSTHSFESPRRDTTDTARLARGEKAWFLITVAALGVLLLSTLAFIPYGDNAEAAGQQQVTVVGRQFAWQVSPGTIRAGVPARFAVGASDVNHGFAVYNDDNVLLFQIQAVPESTSHIVYTFKEPGRYQVVCLEFCGIDHHKMVGTLQVER